MKVETFTPANVMKPIGPYSHIAFLKNVADFEDMNRAYREAFANHSPARTVVAVSELPKQGALMTMNLTAVTQD